VDAAGRGGRLDPASGESTALLLEGTAATGESVRRGIGDVETTEVVKLRSVSSKDHSMVRS